MSDFFGEYFAPGALFVGAGVTGYRSFRDVNRSGVVQSSWRTQRDVDAFLQGSRKSRAERYKMTAEELTDAMYLESGRYSGHAGFNTELGRNVFREARGRTVGSLISNFSLEGKAKAMGIDNPADISREQLSSLLRASPAHVKHLERAARANDMLSVTGLPTKADDVQHRMSIRSNNALESMTSVSKQIRRGKGRTVQQVVEGSAHLRNQLSVAKFMREPVPIGGADQLRQALMSSTSREDLTMRALALYEQVGKMDNVSMKLLYMNEGAKEFISGIRITSNQASNPIDVPIVGSSGEVRMGFYGHKKMIARQVGAAGVFDWIQKGTGNVSEKLDTALLGYLSENFSSYAGGKKGWGSFMRSITGSYKEDIGRAIMPLTANRALNQKIAQQTTFRNLPFGPQDVPMEQLDARAFASQFNPREGLSPTQQESGIRALREPGARPWGAQSVGAGTGDDKTLAQAVRDKVVVSRAKARATVQGALATKLGDVRAQIRAYSMPQTALEALMAMSSRRDIGLHEDVAILADNNIRFVEKRQVAIRPDSAMTERLADILESDWYQPFREAASSSLGVSGTLGGLTEQMHAVGVDTEEGKQIARKMQLIMAGSRLDGSTILGERHEGGFVKGPKSGVFNIERMGYLSRTEGPRGTTAGQLFFEGLEENRLGVSDKTFLWKRVITGAMNKKEIQYMAGLFEVSQGKISASTTPEDLHRMWAPQMASFHKHMAKTKWRGAIEELVPSGVNASAWRETIDKLSDIQALDVQGFKKIGDRTMDFVSHSLISDFANEAQRVRGRIADLDLALNYYAEEGAPREYRPDEKRVVILEDQAGVRAKYTGLPTLRNDHSKLSPNERRIAAVDEAYRDPKTGFVDLDAMMRDRESYKSRVAPLKEALTDAGVTMMREYNDGRVAFILDDTIDDPAGPKNLANRFDRLLLATMKENAESHGVAKWSGETLFKGLAQEWAGEAWVNDLRLAENMTATERVSTFQRIMAEESTREKAIRGLQGQLQYGMNTHSFSVEGSPKTSTASGGRGSFNYNMLRHMKTQEGVMDDLAMEFIGRTAGDKSDEAVEVYRRMGAFYEGVSERAKTVSLAELAQKFEIDSPVIDSLFSRNQFARDESFSAVQAAFGLEPSDNLIFDLGEGGESRYIYHPRGISSHTGGYMTSAGQATISGVDRSTKDIISAFKRQDRSGIEAGVARYDDELRKISIGKGQAPTKMLSGKIQGSFRAQAVPQKANSLFELAGLNADEVARFSNSIGIRESQFESMLTDMGQVDDFDDRLRDLRRGRAVAVISRQPATELHRISSVNMYSVDEIFRRASSNLTRGMKDADIAAEIMSLGMNAYRKAKADFDSQNSNSKGALDSAEARSAWWREKHAQTWANTYGDNAVFLARQMEMILGADYDNDQLDVILARSGEFDKRLKERASFQTRLLSDGATPEAAMARAQTAAEKAAAEDYIYKYHQRDLYAGLKTKAEGAVITQADLDFRTPEWKSRAEGQALQAYFEKGYIGSMTNSTDFVREVLRARGPGDRAEGRLFTEMLLGIMPEVALKARQHGPKAMTDPEYGLSEGITNLRKVLSGEARRDGLNRQEQIDLFGDAFKKVYRLDPRRQDPLVERMLRFAPDVVDAAGAGERPENLITKYLKSSPERMDRKGVEQLLRHMRDPSVPSHQGAMFRDALRGIGIEGGQSEFKRHLKNTAAGFGEVFQALKRHKNPALIGTAVAVSASVLLGSPGSISESEANAAGARSQHSNPGNPSADFQNSVPVATGNGKSIRIRGRSDGDIDMSSVSSAIQSNFPGADVSYTMNDYRERMNEEYLRRRLLR